MAIPESSSADTPQDGEAPDNSDKPPQESASLAHQLHKKLKLAQTNAMNGSSSLLNGKHITHDANSFPLPPPDTLNAGLKEPGLTRDALAKLAAANLDSAVSSSSSSDHLLHTNGKGSQKAAMKLAIDPHSPAFDTLQSFPSPNAVSPTDSYWEGPSAPPSRPASRPGSRAPSMSAGTSGNKLASPVPPTRERRGSKSDKEKPRSKPASIHSDKGDSHKFTLKDLLNSGPKLNRKSSQRSTSSRRSDSDAGEGRARSTAGDSTTSLTQKYGVTQKVAIGKGATSVVRLAHKWDRTEEKLYAIKVGFLDCRYLSASVLTLWSIGVPQASQERIGERIREETHRRILYLLHLAPS